MTMTTMTTTRTTMKTRKEQHLLLSLRPGLGYLPLLLRLASGTIGKKWMDVEAGWAAWQGAREPCVKAREQL